MSSEGADLTAWDSMAAHDQGLERFADLFRKSRKKTRTEEISVPYRNGIMHGMDLEYDNEIVAAKCWAALFAVREWALKAENGELTPPPEEPEPTLAEVLEKEQQIQESKKKREEWEPRDIVVGRDVPVTGNQMTLRRILRSALLLSSYIGGREVITGIWRRDSGV
jgi:hypothetical protein